MLRKTFVSFICCLTLAAGSAVGQQTINLFERNNLADWNFHVFEAGVDHSNLTVGDVFTFTEDGRLIATGLPYGYLSTKESYKNYKFAFEWRWPAEPTNSGIFIKITDMPANSFLPKAIEVQLRHTDAGDMYGFNGRTITDSPERIRNFNHAALGQFMGVFKIRGAELPPGQWNKMEILVVDTTVVVTVNGRIVNWTTGAEAIAGQIGFQSEGSPIEFRNAVITVLP